MSTSSDDAMNGSLTMRQDRWRRVCGVFLCALLITLPSRSAHAQIPHLIRYQGQAVDSKGVPLEGPYTLTFRFYDAASGGTKVWEETQPNVPLTTGRFSVLLGQITSLTTLDWSSPCWLAVQVNTDPELTPRQQITSVPWAMRAETAEITKTSGLTDDTNRLVPSGAIILWDGAACPVGYTRLSTYDDRFLVASSTAGTTGGSNTHDHVGATGSHTLTVAEIPSHTHRVGRGDRTDPGSMRGLGSNNVYGFQDATVTETTGGGQGHTHTIAPADSRPAFKTVLLCKKD